MAVALDQQFEHLFRRAGFGSRPEEIVRFRSRSVSSAYGRLLNYAEVPDDVDTHIGNSDYLGITASGSAFLPNSNITHARQRWLFRMVHSNRPLQEKMTLFWHNHFATGYSKIAGLIGTDEATRYMAAKSSDDPGRVRGQLEMLRDNALGNFQDILVAIAKDTAMLFWLDGRTNIRSRPQENFGRELMELFTMGVGNFTEADVYAAARVFTGWNLARPGAVDDPARHYEFVYLANQHETSAKTFSFPVYADGGHTIPARAAGQGMQDGLDLIAGLAANPNTGRYLATKLYRFFVSESGPVSEGFVTNVARTYFQSRYNMRTVVAEALRSPEFWDERSYFARFSWPAEFVARSIKEVGWRGFSAGDALTPLSGMGQVLYDPPDVNGWDLGPLWFSTGSMLTRMNFASTLAANQRFKLIPALKPYASNPDSLLARTLELVSPAPYQSAVRQELLGYLNANGPWTGSDSQLEAKLPALMHLIVGSAEYQLV